MALLAGSIAAASLFSVALLIPATAFAHDASPLSAPTAPLPQGGTNVEVEGTIEILHEHLLDGRSAYRHVLHQSDGTTISLKGVKGADLLTGDRVRASGIRSGHALHLPTEDTKSLAQDLPLQAETNKNLAVMQYAPLDSTFGVQTVAVMLVTFSNDPRQPYTPAQARAQLDIADAFFQENSYGQTSLAVDVFGWYTLPIGNTTCDRSQITTYARQAAQARGVDLTRYKRHVFAFPSNPACTFGGLSTVGGNPSSVWMNGNSLSYHALVHELGHSLGLYHSHALLCHPKIVDGTCTVQEYGDVTDMMGGNGHFNAFQKLRLGWLGFGDSPSVTTVETGGTYSIDAYEFPSTGSKALKIPRGTGGQFFYVEMRRNQGFDSDLYRSGVFVHLGTESNPDSSLLLDMVPETLTIAGDALLDIGKSFTDPVTGTTIKTVAASNTAATILVSIGTGCTRSAPLVVANPVNTPAVPARTATTYNISVTNTDSAACPTSSITVRATPPALAWQTGFDISSVTMSPGATSTLKLTIASPDVAPASYPIVVSATTGATPVLASSASVSYTVAPTPPPPSVPPTSTSAFTDAFDRPDAPELGNGWSVARGSLAIQSGEARNVASQTANVAVQPGLKGSAQTVQVSFASTNNNSSPRFAVVLRYQDSKNYYLCSRQLGGSSVARISRVRNGSETVLKSVSLKNSAVNAFSTISCQASGNTLTLSLDGVAKVLATDATFTTGSAGFAITASKAGSHRVDNFSANVQ